MAQAYLCEGQAGGSYGEAPLSTPPLEGAFKSILPDEEASPKKEAKLCKRSAKGWCFQARKLSSQGSLLKLQKLSSGSCSLQEAATCEALFCQAVLLKAVLLKAVLLKAVLLKAVLLNALLLEAGLLKALWLKTVLL